MALSSLRISAVPPTHLSGLKPSVPPSGIRSFQVRCKRDSEVESPKRLSVTRRDAMICLTTSSLNGIGLSSPEIAEAGMAKSEIRQKIKENLEMLRKKAGLSKRKETDKEKSSSPSSSIKKEKVLSLKPPPLPLPIPPQGGKKSVIEATL